MTGQSHETLASFRKVSASSNRKFGLTIGIILMVVSIMPTVLHRHPLRLWLLALGVMVFVAGWLAPALLGPLNRVWFKFGLLLGRVTNPIVMGVLFFAVLTPIGWLLRITGHDLLRLRADAKAESYWINRDPKTASMSLTKQF